MKKKHKTKRKSPGRPKLPESEKKEKTKPVRIPLSRVEEIKELIKNPKGDAKP
jgi:hypothetical protein